MKRRIVNAGRKAGSSTDIPVISRAALLASNRAQSSPTLLSSSPTSSLPSPRLDSPTDAMVFPLPKEISQLGLQDFLVERVGGKEARLDSLDSLSSLDSLDDLDSRLLPIELECADGDVLTPLSLPQEIEIELEAGREVNRRYTQPPPPTPFPVKTGQKKVILQERPFTPKGTTSFQGSAGKVYLHL